MQNKNTKYMLQEVIIMIITWGYDRGNLIWV